MAALSHLRRALAGLVFVTALLGPAAAQDGLRLIEQDIKAGLVYNFLRYTRWPAPAQSEPALTVCLYGGDPFDGRLAPMAGRTVNRRAIQLRAISAERELDQCSAVFINADVRAQWPRLRTYLARRSILTVSDYDGFARAGGMLEFTRLNNRIGVLVNVEAARAADLEVQDRLLRLASVVRTEER